MKKYTVELTRQVSSTESVEVEIEARDADEARQKVLALPDECNNSCPDGVTSHEDEDIGGWSVESVNSDDADQAECLQVLTGHKAA